MTAPRFLHDIWSPHGQSSAVTDRTVLRLQKINGAPAGKRSGNALLNWRPTHHNNVLLTGALPDTGSNLESMLHAWRSAKLEPHRRIFATDFSNHPRTDGEIFGRFDGVRGVANEVRDWEVDHYEEQGLPLMAAERRSAGAPDRILPGTTLGEALDGLVDRLATPKGPGLANAMLHDVFKLELMWGGHEPAFAMIRYRGELLHNDNWVSMTWCGVYMVEKTPLNQMSGLYRTTRTIRAPIFLDLADAWSRTKAALADAASSSVPPAAGTAVTGPEGEDAAPGRAAPSKVPTNSKRKTRSSTDQNLLASGSDGRSRGSACARATRGIRLFSPSARSDFDHDRLHF